ncbi:MAG: nucleoside-diphosphate sugar epimerase/dehydratase [Microthrixaceae bacterium]
MRNLMQRATGQRFLVQAVIDFAAWTVALWLATYFRYEMAASEVSLIDVFSVSALACLLQLILGRASGLYVHRWRYGTYEEISATMKVVLMVAPVIIVANLLWPYSHALPTSATISAGFISLMFMFSARFVWRYQREAWSLAADEGRGRAIVIGAGEGGLQIVSAMLKAGPWHPVAILDDNRDLKNLRVKGVPVCGDRNAMQEVARRFNADAAIIAIPSASSEDVRDLAELADNAGLEVMILPPVGELFGTGVGVSDIRPLTEADLLGRREISLDIESVAGYLTGKRVLVTGAGGSIGSELCRQIHRFAPSSLIMLDRDESALQAVQLSIEGRSLLNTRQLVIGCIRDKERMAQVFTEHQPHVVFHTAALKHLPLLEMYPEEGWKTNVSGTQNLLELAGEFNVERFVNISTDKAADATSVLGETKRAAERLTAHASKKQSGTYLSVRFGNVLGSRGSVLPLFRSQIEQGGPVTVTHPEITRFFMTIPEACGLVIQAGALDSDGEVLVLDMGEPVKIASLAKRLIAESGKRVEIVYTGLRDGEKLHEVLFSDDELGGPSEHPLIMRVDVPSISPEDVFDLRVDRGASVIDLRAQDDLEATAS